MTAIDRHTYAKSGICPVCGRMAQRQRTFEDTVNKPAFEWMLEWRDRATYHADCENRA